MKIKNGKDFWAGLLFVATGLAFALGATHYPVGASVNPGPGFAPLLLGLLLALVGALLLFKALSVETEDGAPVGALAWRPLLAVAGGVALFGLTLPRLGLLLALPLLVVMVGLGARGLRWRSLLLTALVLTALCWLVFVWGLQLRLPLSPGWASPSTPAVGRAAPGKAEPTRSAGAQRSAATSGATPGAIPLAGLAAGALRRA